MIPSLRLLPEAALAMCLLTCSQVSWATASWLNLPYLPGGLLTHKLSHSPLGFTSANAVPTARLLYLLCMLPWLVFDAWFLISLAAQLRDWEGSLSMHKSWRSRCRGECLAHSRHWSISSLLLHLTLPFFWIQEPLKLNLLFQSISSINWLHLSHFGVSVVTHNFHLPVYIICMNS